MERMTSLTLSSAFIDTDLLTLFDSLLTSSDDLSPLVLLPPATPQTQTLLSDRACTHSYARILEPLILNETF